MYARQYSELYETYLDSKSAWDESWRNSAFSAEYLLSLTADELRGLKGELNELVERWRERSSAAREAGDVEGRENVAVHMNGFPFRTA
ncbi:hypothetical protein GCM10022419_105610 [Nonomuraea rosea]|uniref:Uncharacterized protein n=1 Tax=Nonomuraea rosea TaxID=638574 RepID=A0ABP6ZB93_9ACTN